METIIVGTGKEAMVKGLFKSLQFYAQSPLLIKNGKFPGIRKNRIKLNKEITALFENFYQLSFIQLEMFVRLMKELFENAPELERSKFYSTWKYYVHQAGNIVFKRREGVRNFYVIDRKGDACNNLHTLPTMEALIDFITVKSGSQIKLHQDILKGRYVVIGGRRIQLCQEIKEIQLEVNLNL
jgi:hypothetical protein